MKEVAELLKLDSPRFRRHLATFTKNFVSFVDTQNRELDAEVIARILCKLLSLSAMSTVDQIRRKKARSRERVKDDLPLLRRNGGKNVTETVQYRNELLHYLIRGNGTSFSTGTQYLTQKDAAWVLAEWLLQLGLV